MKTNVACLLSLLLTTLSALAHPGHHHESGLPDFSAHLLLGFQYLAGILTCAAIAFFLRRAFKGKSRKADLPPENP